MNYQYHYDMLIASRKERIPEEGAYYEKHHIIPRSKGGSDNESNLIFLTAREHFIAHWLLWRIYRDKSSAFAFKMMSGKRKDGKRYSSSRSYAESKESTFLFMKGSSPMKGKTMTDEHKKKILESRKKTYSKNRESTGKCFSQKHSTIEKISESTKGEKNPMYGTSFFKKWVEKYGQDIAEKMKSDVYSKRISRGRTKKLKFISPFGQEFIIEGGMKQFCKENSLNYGRVSQVINGKRDNEKGWKITQVK